MKIVIIGHHHKHHCPNHRNHHFHQVMPQNPGEVVVKPAQHNAAMSANETESFATAETKYQPPHLHFVRQQPPPHALLRVLR
jgi:hypothetical protein